MSEPPISVVVCTHERPAALARCLAALRQLDYPAYEVIVVDNASHDAATRQVVAATPFRYLREERAGLDWARNCGLAAAQHSLVAYTDDDTEAAAGWLRGIAKAFADPQVALVTGLVLPATLQYEAQRLFERYSGMGKGAQAQLFQGAKLTPREIIAAHQYGVGANMAFRRELLESLGGFDSALDVGTPSGGAGDIDIFHRALASGLSLRYEPTALVYHHHRADLSGLERQIRANGQSFGVYLLKIWARRSVPRRATARFALGWAVGWLGARLALRLLGRLDFPLRLVWAEVAGALRAPVAYGATYRRDRELRRVADEYTKQHSAEA